MAINRSIEPKDVIKTTQTLLVETLAQFVNEGEKLPSDPKEIGALIALTRAIGDTAQTTRKLDIEERAVEEVSQLARDYKYLVEHARTLITGRDIEGECVAEGPKPDKTRLVEVKLLEGQMDSVVPDIDVDEFMAAGKQN
ncbi:hypothetical protein ACLPJK_25955 [Pseudomonas aeruginosa]|uniref:hypothetical protein n=1 Tax=Pseudomonas aeruginosa TaxID=287 RepID=UPI003D2A3C21